MSFKIKLPRSKFPGTSETDTDNTISMEVPILTTIPNIDHLNIETIDKPQSIDRTLESGSTDIHSVIYLGNLIYKPGMKLPSYNDPKYQTISIQHSNIPFQSIHYRWTIYISACYLTTKSVMDDKSIYCKNQNNSFLSFLYQSNITEFSNDSENYPVHDLKVILEQIFTLSQHKIIQIDKIEFGTSIRKDNLLWKCQLINSSSFRRRFLDINLSSIDSMPLGLPSYQSQLISSTSGQIGIKYSLVSFFEHLMSCCKNDDICKQNASVALYHCLSDGLSNILKNRKLLFETYNGTQYEFTICKSKNATKKQFCIKTLGFGKRSKILCSEISFCDINWTDNSIHIHDIECGPIKLFRILKNK